MINRVLALTAYKIITSQLKLQQDADHKFFRIKNFTDDEIIDFVKIWSDKNCLNEIRLIVASNVKNSLPIKFVAEMNKSITYYRNNNQRGLVYVETKTQSDEQGLQNIFTLHDSNFLDGSFDIKSDSDVFIVSDEIIESAWEIIGGESKLSTLLKQRSIEVLDSIKSLEKVSLRNFAKFIVNLLSEYEKISRSLSEQEVNELIGNNLIYLDCFRDIYWRKDDKKTNRRLQLNLNYSDLILGSQDIDPDELISKVSVFKFKNVNKVPLDKYLNEEYIKHCTDFIKSQSAITREKIPFFIFEQLFLPDVIGLLLGDRVSKEIQESDLARFHELISLNVIEGLNRRSEDDARRFLEHEPIDSCEKLQNLLTVRTRGLVEQLANPKALQFFNPLLEIVEIVDSLKDLYNLDNSYVLEIKHGKRHGRDQNLNNQSLRLFNFLFGKSLKSVSDKSKDNSFGLSLKLDSLLLSSIEPLAFNDDEEYTEDELDESEVLWSPIPISFDLLDVNGKTLYSITNKEWYPPIEDLHYFAFFWLLLCAKESNFKNINSGIQVDFDFPLNKILQNFVNRITPLTYILGNSKFIDAPATSDLLNIRSEFLNKLCRDGLDAEAINEYLDLWQPLFTSTRISLIPDGTRIPAISQLLDLDFLCFSNSKRRVMIPSHPIRLRWIAKYLLSCEDLLVSFLTGDAKLSNLNPKFYLDWLRTVTPSQSPAIASDQSGEILFSSGDQAWFEEFVTKTNNITSAILDVESTRKVSKQITSYLEAHPYKGDGLSILLLAPYTNTFPADLISSIKNSEWKRACINITVIAYKSKWHEISTYFDGLHDENRMVKDDRLFPLYDLSFIEYKEKCPLAEMLDGLKFDIAVITHLLSEDVISQDNTEAPNLATGSFDPLLDRPTQLSGGINGGTISILMKPDESDEILETWSTHVIRSNRLRPIAPSQPENTDFLELRVNFESSANIFVELHEICHWVITLERHISRQQIESLESSPDILSIEEGVGSNTNFTLIVSANSGKELIISRISRKLQRLLVKSGLLQHSEIDTDDLAAKIYNQTRKFAPRLALKAMGISWVTEEIIGLMVARSLSRLNQPLLEENLKWIYASISLDEHHAWFGGPSEIRADICNFCFVLKSNKLQVDVEVIEAKLRQVYDGHGVSQAKLTCDFFEDILTHKDRVDAKLWRDQIISAIETSAREAVQTFGFNDQSVAGLVPPEIRDKFRVGDYEIGSIKGLYSICLTEGQLSPWSSEVQNDIEVIRTTSADIVPLILGDNKFFYGIKKLDPASSIDNYSPNSTGVIYDISADPRHELAPLHIDESKAKIGKVQNLNNSELRVMYQTILDCYADSGVDVDPAPESETQFIEGPASILFKLSPRHATDPKKLKDKSQVLKLKLLLEQDQEIRFLVDRGFVQIDVPKLPNQRYFVMAEDMWARWSRPLNSLAAPLGEDSFGSIVDVNFTDPLSPHLLIGGTTGSGKSEALNVLLYGLVNYYSPKELRLLLVDPKGTELQGFSKLPHLQGAISWDDLDALDLLKSAVVEMQSRYIKLRSNESKSITEFNSKVSDGEKLPWWLVVLDEYADLTAEPSMKKEIEAQLKRLAQKARAAGIHVIIATQKPSAEVISTNLRSNLPAQLALRVRSATESRVIMDDSGAEMLNGKGDSYLKAGGYIKRVQCGLVTKEGADKIISRFNQS